MTKKTSFILAAVLVLACVGAYWNAPGGEFVWDDINLIVMDYQIRDISFIKNVFTRDFFGFQDNARKYGYFRPIITISFMIDYALWELDAAGYHITNIITHILATIFIFLIFLRLVPGKALGPFIAALLFAVHPIHTENVTWISGRTDTICGMFFFSSLWFFIVYAQRLAAEKVMGAPNGVIAAPLSPTQAKSKKYYLIASLVCFSLALLSKEMSAVLPGVMLIYVLIFHTGFRRRDLMAFIPAFGAVVVIMAGYALYRYFVVEVSEQAKDPWGFVATLVSFIWTITYYLMKMAWPLKQSGYIQNELVQSVLEPKALLGISVLGLAAWAFWANLNKDKVISFALAFGLVSFAPLSNFVRISGPRDMGFMTAERFVYIPSAPFFLLVGILLARLIGSLLTVQADRRAGQRLHRAVAILLVIVMTGAYTFLTIRRNEVWRSNENFFTDCIAKAPTAPLLYMVLGNIYSLMGDNYFDKAENTLKTAIEYLSPRDREEPTWIYSDLAGVYAKQKQYDKSLEMMKLAARGRLRNSAVEFNMGEIYRMMGDLDKASNYYKRSLDIDKKNIKALEQLGLVLQQLERWEESNETYIALSELLPNSARVRINIGRNYMMMREYRLAVTWLNRAKNHDPNRSLIFELLGNAFLSMEKADEGLVFFKRALEIDPKNYDAKASLGNALFTVGQKVEAHKILREVLGEQPDNIKALMGMGILASDQGKQNIAENTFTQVLRLEPKNVRAMLSLGILAYKNNQMDKAKHWFSTILSLDHNNKVARTYLARVGLPVPEPIVEAKDD
jgi:protein O-mannosyl-transferase